MEQEKSRTGVVLCPWLHVHQYYWIRAGKKRETQVFEPETKVARKNFMVLRFCLLEGFLSLSMKSFVFRLTLLNFRCLIQDLRIRSQMSYSASKTIRETGTSRQWFSPHNIKMTKCFGNMGLENKGRRVSFGLWFLSLRDAYVTYFLSKKEGGRQKGIFSYMNTWHPYSFKVKECKLNHIEVKCDYGIFYCIGGSWNQLLLHSYTPKY